MAAPWPRPYLEAASHIQQPDGHFPQEQRIQSIQLPTDYRRYSSDYQPGAQSELQPQQAQPSPYDTFSLTTPYAQSAHPSPYLQQRLPATQQYPGRQLAFLPPPEKRRRSRADSTASHHSRYESPPPRSRLSSHSSLHSHPSSSHSSERQHHHHHHHAHAYESPDLEPVEDTPGEYRLEKERRVTMIDSMYAAWNLMRRYFGDGRKRHY